MAASIEQQLRARVDNPFAFLAALKIIDPRGIERSLSVPFPEQVALINAMSARTDEGLPQYTNINVLKPRQIGFTTAIAAWNFTYGYRVLDPVKTLIVAHEADASENIFRKLKHFHNSLPTKLQRPMQRSNRKELEFADTGSAFRCMTAGGRGHARSFTNQRAHLDEAAFMPGGGEDVYASVSATIHPGPHECLITSSTPNGPGGLFHRLCIDGMEGGDPNTLFMFFRWSDHQEYRATPPIGWEPEQEEVDMAATYGLDLHQVYWRSREISKIGEDRFRREYPLTVEDGFLEFQGAFFDVKYLNDILSSLQMVKENVELRVYEDPDPNMTYAIGADPSWGTGNDYAAAQVVSHDGRQVATLSSKHWRPEIFAQKVADLSLYYNRARVMVEANTGGGGSVVIEKLISYGTPLWWGQRSGHWVTSNQGRTRNGGWKGSKGPLYDHCRSMVNDDNMTLNDFPTVRQLLNIREDSVGRIEGANGMNDDLGMALALACWNLRTLDSPHESRKLGFKRKRKTLATPF